jgi:hypothetical protein
MDEAVERVVRVWMLIKNIPRDEELELRDVVSEALVGLRGLDEHSLVVAGLKHLYVRERSRAARANYQTAI